MLALGRRYEQIRGEVLAAVGPRQHYILGPEVEVLERELADFCGGATRWNARLARTLSPPLE
jgi:hypothetical protein